MASPATFSPAQNTRLYQDGAINETWATVRDAATADGMQDGVISGASAAATTYNISRVGLSFDTSSIPDNATITVAVIKIYPYELPGNADTVHLDVVSFAPTNPASHAVADYAKAKWGTTPWGSITYATLGANLNALNSITLDASGIANVSKTGTCSFGLRVSRDTDDSAPGGTNLMYMTFAQTVLVVTYTLPSSGFFALL